MHKLYVLRIILYKDTVWIPCVMYDSPLIYGIFSENSVHNYMFSELSCTQLQIYITHVINILYLLWIILYIHTSLRVLWILLYINTYIACFINYNVHEYIFCLFYDSSCTYIHILHALWIILYIITYIACFMKYPVHKYIYCMFYEPSCT